MPAVESLGAWFGSTISTLISPFYTLFSKHATYCFTARSNVMNHKTETQTLEGNILRVRQAITDGERRYLIPTDEADRWLQRAEQAKSEEEANRVSFENRRRIFGCSLNCWGNYKISKKAAEKVDIVKAYINSTPVSDNVTILQPPRHVQEMPGPSMSAENSNLQDALEYIKDDFLVGVIGIWGPGGVGKTHLLKNINNYFREDRTFNFVLFITASRGCTVEKVQLEIIKRLGLPEGSESHSIFEYMKKKSFLVLLDDLWDPINLDDVGIPYRLENANNLKRKVVLTTRLREICGQMKVKKELKVGYLKENEAWLLFEENIGPQTLSSPHIEALARQLMKELKGLPLALITIGKAMYQKDTAQWETAIQYMKKSCCTDDKDPIELGMEINVFKQLKFSYDKLQNNTLRDCFLTCAIWPEDEKIHKDNLAQCWMGLGLVNEQDIESSFRKSYSLIADLTSVCLLEDIEGSYGSVKVHDVIRDMALWISCDCGENNDKWIISAPVGVIIPWNRMENTVECISLAKTDDDLWFGPACNRETQPFPTGFNPIKLRILCLRNTSLEEGIICNGIENFISLTYLDLRNTRLGRIPKELCSLVKLEYLDLSQNDHQLKEVPQSFGNLINLKFLYLRSSGVRKIPIEVIYSLKALQVIDLRFFSTDVEPDYRTADFMTAVIAMGSQPQMKALGIEARSLREFESLREAAKVPIRYLALMMNNKSKLLRNYNGSTLYLSDILSNEFSQRTLYDLNIHSCFDLEQIIVRQDTQQPNNHFGALKRLRLARMYVLKEITWMEATPASILPRLTCLVIYECTSLVHLSWVMYLPCLEDLRIVNCDSMVEVFMRSHGDNLCNGQENTKTFPCLKVLFLLQNTSLETIGDNGMEFPSLERLVLRYCHKLKRLPFKSDSYPLKLKELWFNDVQEWERLDCEEALKILMQPALKYGTTY